MANARFEKLFTLYSELEELITAEEKETYPFIAHLEDFLDDLETSTK